MVGSNYCQRKGGTQIKTHPTQNLDSVFLENKKNSLDSSAKLKSKTFENLYLDPPFSSFISLLGGFNPTGP